MFQQQVKNKIGGESGDPLVNENQFGVSLAGYYRINDNLNAGIFTRIDLGSREAARFLRIDEDGKAEIQNRVGGNFNELWIGPIIKIAWRQLSLDIGYALYGLRNDDGRDDLPDNNGNTDEAFNVNPSVAWLLALGGDIPIIKNLALNIKFEYRVRYYNERAGKSLQNNIEHGTQSISPLIGISYRL